jgi:hypothetical protein
MTSGRRIGVAGIGCGGMGRVHARAYVRVRHHFPGRPYGSVLADAVASAVLLDAMTESVARGRWVELARG